MGCCLWGRTESDTTERLSSSVKDFTGSLVVKTLLSSAGGTSSIPCEEAKIPHVLGQRNQNIKVIL